MNGAHAGSAFKKVTLGLAGQGRAGLGAVYVECIEKRKEGNSLDQHNQDIATKSWVCTSERSQAM